MDKKDALLRLLKEAAFGGWSQETLEKSCPNALILFPKGIADAVAAFAEEMDTKMEAHCSNESFSKLKIREKIQYGLMFRLKEHQKNREAIRRLMTYYAMPHHAPEAAAHAWKTADRLWYLAGDTATDYNYYTKRTLLVGVYTATLLSWSTDSTPDLSVTQEFLTRRIEDVMKIEGVKKTVKGWLENFSGKKFG
jgi:ubiquinone biosynthesis protein COQ9